MPIVVLTTAAGAPGASTTALGLALMWGGPTLLIEADPGGTSIVSGWYRAGIDPRGRNLLNLALGDPRSDLTEAIFDQAVTLDNPPVDEHQRLLLIGLTEPAQAAALQPWWEPIGEALRTLSAAGYTVIVDAGRLTQGSYPMPLLGFADQVLLVCRNTVASALRSYPLTKVLRRALEQFGNPDTLSLAVVSDPDGGYQAPEIARELGIAFSLSLPYEPRSAAMLSDGAARPAHLMRRLKVRLTPRGRPAVDAGAATHATSTDSAAGDDGQAGAGVDDEPAAGDRPASGDLPPAGLLRAYRSAAREVAAHIKRRDRRLHQPTTT